VFQNRDKVDLVAPKDKKKVAASGQVEGIAIELFHFKKIQEGVVKEAIWRVIERNIGLFAPNEDDCPPYRCLKDVEGTSMLWEEEISCYLKASND
jgi:hypothetical protein